MSEGKRNQEVGGRKLEVRKGGKRGKNLTRGPWALTLCLRTNLAICQSSTYTPFLPQGSKWSLFSLYEQRFLRSRPIFKIAIFEHDTWRLAKVKEVPHILSFYQLGPKLSLFSLYGQQFARYGSIFKSAIFGHETWPLAKVPDVAHILSLYSRGLKLSLFFLLYSQWFLRYGPSFKVAIFGHEIWPLVKVPEVAEDALFLPCGCRN